MNEFDLRNYLYNNPLMEKKEDSKKGNKEEQKRMEGAIRDDRDHIKDLKKDIEDNEKKLAKLKKDFKKDVNETYDSKYEEDDMKEEMDSKYEEDDMKEEMEDKKLTKEGLKNMIREKITSILNEESIDEGEISEDAATGDAIEKLEDKLKLMSSTHKGEAGDKYLEASQLVAKAANMVRPLEEQEDVDVDEEEDVDVDVEKDVNVDVEDEVDVDDESVESDIEVKTSVPGESADVDAVLGLLTKAQSEAKGMGDEVLMDQIGNTITYFTRKHVVKASS
jgi:hypothetical protein